METTDETQSAAVVEPTSATSVPDSDAHSEAPTSAAATTPAESTASQPTVTVPPVPQLTTIKYTYQAGDTLFGLFLRYHVSVSNIRRWNNLVAEPTVGESLKLQVLQ